MSSFIVLLGLLLTQPMTSAQAPAASLLDSAKLGDLPGVRERLSRSADINAADRNGRTSLMWAAASGSLAVVQELLARGAAVERRAGDGTTALMLASSNGFTEIVRALLLKGANVAHVAGGNTTARQLALDHGHAGVVLLLDQAEALGRRLLQAASEGNDTAVRQALAMGAPVNISDERGTTALMMAARNGDLGMLQALLSRGADPAVRDSQGRDVFEWAEPSPTTAKFVVAFLLERGATKNAPRAALLQSPQVKASLATLASVLARVPPAPAPVRAAQQRANAALTKLQALSAKWPAESPDDYRDNLAEYVEALEAALTLGDAGALAATVNAIADDLEVKLEHCTASGGRLGGSVVVRVRTVQAGIESRSWQVFYMPRVFEAARTATPDLFPQLSSPTEEALVPGRYVMWVRDPATARLGERTVVKVGEGRKELLVDLPVPAALPQ